MNIPLFKISWDESDINAVGEAISSGMNWAIGEKVEEFEKAIAKYLGVKAAAVLNSGTSALHAILLAYGIGIGDEVIVPSFTFPATANAVLYVGATPIFADIENETYGLDPKDVETRITDRTKAIIAVHYGGQPCQIRALKQVADKHRLILIEDAAEAMGARIGKKKVGTFGEAAMLSFCQNKIITTGDGGAVVSSDTNLIERVKLIRNHGDNDVFLGYNWRMPNLLAALGLSQLKKIDKLIKARRAIASQYLEAGIGSKPFRGYYHVYQLFTLKRSHRNHLKEKLERNGVASKVYFEPVHLTNFYKGLGWKKGMLPRTEKVSRQVLTIPVYPTLAKEEIDHIKALCS